MTKRIKKDANCGTCPPCKWCVEENKKCTHRCPCFDNRNEMGVDRDLAAKYPDFVPTMTKEDFDDLPPIEKRRHFWRFNPMYAEKFGSLDRSAPQRRPRANLVTILRSLLKSKVRLRNPLTAVDEELSVGEGLMIQLVYRGLNGNLKAIQQIFERLEKSGDLETLSDMEKAAGGAAVASHDLSKLSTEELIALRDLTAKVQDADPLDLVIEDDDSYAEEYDFMNTIDEDGNPQPLKVLDISGPEGDE